MDSFGGRQKRVTDGGKGVARRGGPVNTGGPVGRADGYAGRGSGGKRDGGGQGGGGLKLIILIVMLLLGGGGGGAALLSGGGDSHVTQVANPGVAQSSSQSATTQSSSSAFSGSMLSGFTGMNNVSSGWQDGTDNTGKLDRTVSPDAREKRLKLKGNGTDTVTIMVYMCGTDLESRSRMATNDIEEMCRANLADNVNIIIYTGGCKNWQTQGISNRDNQIYQVKNRGLIRLVDSDGEKKMTDPSTLTGFIKFCDANFPADRKELIFWDHGGGSVSGYGYDEKFPQSGSMDLAGIDEALRNAGVTFDFIGFDACLMATLETGLMLEPYADYLIASEETEPGIGWYYTNWLTELSANTSMETLEIGKNICDDFVSTCAQKCPGQKTTLSVTDLAELSQTVPAKLSAFSEATSDMIKQDHYLEVSNARAGTREFAVSSKIDQIDLVNFANNLGTQQADALSDALLSAVKYNRTASNMTNAYGVSIYFPYKKAGRVSQAVNTYKRIGLGAEYGKCIQSFAGLQQSGQIAAGGSGSPLTSLIGQSGGYSSSQVVSSQAIGQLLGAFMSGGRSVPGLDEEDAQIMQDPEIFDAQSAADYIAVNQFDESALKWETDEQGRHLLAMSDENWALIQTLLVNMFVDDGEGYIDMGLDNLYEFTDDGRLIGDTDNTWLSIDSQPVAFYYENTVINGDDECISGRVPVLLDGVRADLIITFDGEHPYGYIAGARYDYISGETDTVAKSLSELEAGMKIDFLADYYSYDGTYQNSYMIGEQWEYHDDAMISNTDVGKDSVVTYVLTDIYNREHWTPPM